MKIVNIIENDITWMVRHIFKMKLWSLQRLILESIFQYQYVTVKTCHGVGKSAISGTIILSFLLKYRPSIVLSTAPTSRQVNKIIWKEVRKYYKQAAIDIGGNLLPKSPELQIIQDEWYAMGFSTKDSDRFQGFHNKNLLVLVDEAAGVEDDIFEGIDGILTSSNNRLLLLGNPTNVLGEFYKSFKDSKYKKITISAFDTPNFRQCKIDLKDIENGDWKEKQDKIIKEKGDLITPYLITPTWVADKYSKWGINSPLFQSKILAQFPEQGERNLFPISWVELAMERWHDIDEEEEVKKFLNLVISLGVDVAEHGNDTSVICPKIGRKIVEFKIYNDMDLMQLTGFIKQYYRYIIDKYYRSTIINIDIIGIGSGVEGRLKEQGIQTTRVNVSEAPKGDIEERELFLNSRSQLYWYLRECLDPKDKDCIALPPNDLLLQDLTTMEYQINSKGKIQVESKKDIKKKIGRSPDYADSVMLANAPQHLLIRKEDSYVPKIRRIKRR